MYLTALLEQAQVHDSANTASLVVHAITAKSTQINLCSRELITKTPQERETFSHSIGSDNVAECDEDTDLDVILCNSVDTGRTGRRDLLV